MIFLKYLRVSFCCIHGGSSAVSGKVGMVESLALGVGDRLRFDASTRAWGTGATKREERVACGRERAGKEPPGAVSSTSMVRMGFEPWAPAALVPAPGLGFVANMRGGGRESATLEGGEIDDLVGTTGVNDWPRITGVSCWVSTSAGMAWDWMCTSSLSVTTSWGDRSVAVEGSGASGSSTSDRSTSSSVCCSSWTSAGPLGPLAPSYCLISNTSHSD